MSRLILLSCLIIVKSYIQEGIIMNTKNQFTPLRITMAAVFMAMTIALSSFGVPVPGGHLYLCDIVICTAALLLDPFDALIVGGVGSFLGDLLFYPQAMLVSLVVHGLQAFAISFIVHRGSKKHPKINTFTGLLIGSIIMVVGYTLGKTYVYSTFEYAMIKLPYEIAQAAVGAIFAPVLCYRCGLQNAYTNYTAKNRASASGTHAG